MSIILQSCTWSAMVLFPGKFGRTDFHQGSFLCGSRKWWPWVRWNLTGTFHRPLGVPFGVGDSRLVFCFFFSFRNIFQNYHIIVHTLFFKLKKNLQYKYVIDKGILPSSKKEQKQASKEPLYHEKPFSLSTFMSFISFYP